MFIPIGTDNPLRQRPTMNYYLIGANCLVFIVVNLFLGFNLGNMSRLPSSELMIFVQRIFFLNPNNPRLHNFIMYAFAHANAMHIIGNMLFLWIFGNNVNDKLGNLGYLLLYLAGGVFSGIGHVAFHPAPVIGASGAVAAVTGAYMVLFPNTYITILYLLFFVGTMEIRALYFILFKLIFFDNVLEPRLSQMESNVAFTAHLAGYAFGIAIPLVLLWLKILPHSQFDLYALIQRHRRRRQFRTVVRQGYEPFNASPTEATTQMGKKAPAKDEADPRREKVMDLRGRISQALTASDYTQAAELYIELVKAAPEQVLAQQGQLDVANKLMQMGQYDYAAGAYEAFIERYGGYGAIEQVHLILGLIYSRYLQKTEPARKYLDLALTRLSDPTQRKMCQDELAQL